MSDPTTALAAATHWCFDGYLPEPVPTDGTLTIVNAEQLAEELDVAAAQYRTAVEAGAERVLFVVRDSRAPQARIIDGLRERDVPLGRTSGTAPADDPVVQELFQVVTAMVTFETEGHVPEATRTRLAAWLDEDTDAQAALVAALEADTLRAALDRWVVETDLVDRLLRADDGLHHGGAPTGTVPQRASATHLTEILAAARYLDDAARADAAGATFGTHALATAIEESVLGDEDPLFHTDTPPAADSETARLVATTSVKAVDSADVVIILEATAEQFDADPGAHAFRALPKLSEHPDTPGVTAVSRDRAEHTFGPLPYISDGTRAWFTGLGRRALGTALAAASERALILTRTGADATPSRTVVELAEHLDISQQSVSDILGGTAESSEELVEEGADATPAERVARLEALLTGETAETPGDDATRRVAEHLVEDVRSDALTEAELAQLLELLATETATSDSAGEHE